MTSKRLHLIFTGIIVLLFIGLLGGTYEANKLLVAKGNTLTALKAKSRALSQEQVNLAEAKKDIVKYTDLYSITKAIVPEDKSQAEAVREIVNLAAANNITLGSITFPASTLGSSGPSGTPSGTSAAPNSAALNTKNAANSLSQMTAVKGIPGVYELPITVQSDGNQPVRYAQLSGFLASLEQNRRTAQVTNIAIQPNEDDASLLDFTLVINEYIKP